MNFQVEVIDWLPHGRRPMGKKVNTVVLHATAGSTLDGAIQALRNRKLSYHYIIAKNGRIVKCAPLSGRAFHAGRSVGPQGPNVNDYSIGISLVNLNDGEDPYTHYQIEALKWLIPQLKPSMDAYTFLTTHYAISPGRKTDPRGFPVEALAKAVGLKEWSPE